MTTIIHMQIAERDPHIVDITGKNEGRKAKRQSTSDYSNIRIHTMLVNINSTALYLGCSNIREYLNGSSSRG